MDRNTQHSAVVNHLPPETGRTPQPSARRVVLVDVDDDRASFVSQALLSVGSQVVARLTSSDRLLENLLDLRADLVLLDMDDPVHETLESCAAVAEKVPTPIVIFAKSGDHDKISEAVRAGVSAYVVDGLDASRLGPIIDVAMARFEEQQKLRHELADMRTRLADRRVVEHAKSLLVKMRNIDESEAYALLRRNAMSRRVTVGDAARTVIAAADLIDPDFQK